MNRYEVQENTICDGWANTWHEYDDDNNEIPMRFDTYEEAEVELMEYLNDYRKAYECGDIETPEDPENFRIVEVKVRKFKVTMVRVEYLSQVMEVEAESEDEAQDKAWDESGKWECVNAEEFTNGIEEVV